MNAAETEAELHAWGHYNISRGLDLSLAVYREVMAHQRSEASAADVGKPHTTHVHADTVRATKPGPGRPEHMEENKALREDAMSSDYPSDNVIRARKQDAQAKSAYEASLAEPKPAVDTVVSDTVHESHPAHWPAPKHEETHDDTTDVIDRKGKRHK